MGLIRLLTYLALGAIVWFFVKRYLGKQQRSQPPQPTKPGELIVQCRHCGLHLPQSAALQEGDNHFCSADHRRRWTVRQPR